MIKIRKLIIWIVLLPLEVLKNLIIFLIFPIYFAFLIVNPLRVFADVRQNKNTSFAILGKGILFVFILFTLVLPLWNFGYKYSVQIISNRLGLTPEEINIAGTGSMVPTFPKGKGDTPQDLANEMVATVGMFPYPNGFRYKGKIYFGHELGRGDIVVVQNQKINEITEKIYGRPSSWVKRVIGLPGDTIEIRDGLVYLNEEARREPYTALPHSTFGQTFLTECKKIDIPSNSIFVMGDNRKGSGDSREIGFIKFDDIENVLPLKDQIGFLDKNWRNSEFDLDDSSKIRINKLEYVNLINDKRISNKVSPLKYQSKLEETARLRGLAMLKYDDFSFEATKSAYTMQKAMRDVGYSNILWGEIPTQGYYEASELVENQFEFPDSAKFLLDKDFDEIGISEVEGNLNGCPTQVIVIHFAGYVPPNYSAEDIESWKRLLQNLKDVQPSWLEVKQYQEFYQKHKTDVDRLNEIIAIRISRVSQIVSKMEENLWLNEEEKKYISEESILSSEMQSIASRLNNSQ